MDTLEKQFNQRMELKAKLIAATAKKYIELYDKYDKINELYKIRSSEIDTGYIDEFLKEIREEIIQQLS